MHDNLYNGFLPSYLGHICHILSLMKQAPIWKVTFNIEGQDTTRLGQELKANDWVRMVNTLVDMPLLKVSQFLGQDQQSGPTVNGFEKIQWAPLPMDMQENLKSHLARAQATGISLEFRL